MVNPAQYYIEAVDRETSSTPKRPALFARGVLLLVLTACLPAALPPCVRAETVPEGRPRSPWPSSGILWGGALLGAAALFGAAVLFRRRRRASPAAVPCAAPPSSVEGPLLAGKYTLVRLIGKGGLGEVWQAEDRPLQRVVAVRKLQLDAKERESLLREFQTLSSVRHPNIAEVLEVLDQPSGLHIVYEFLTGKTMAQLLQERRRFTLDQAKQILRPVCAALDFAHGRAVVHRVLKLSSIMLTDEGFVKVTDLGIARGAGAAGSPDYAAPESLKGVVSPAADVYSLAVCLYEMVTGELPMRGTGGGREYVRAVLRVPGLNPAFDDMVLRGLDAHPAERPPGIPGFSAAMEALS